MKAKQDPVASGVWIFQAVPEDWDILIEVPKCLKRADKTERWHVGQHASDMVIGDRVLLWRSGDDAGIYGTGTLTSIPYRQGGERWVDVRFDPLLKAPVFKSALQGDSLLGNLGIIRMPRGTNYIVTLEEWEVLQPLLGLRDSETYRELRSAENRCPDFDPKNKRDARRRVLAEIVRRQGQPDFRRKLLRIFESKCAISGCDTKAVLEAAHVTPYKGTRTNTPQNGILLRSDLHTLFDLCLISIDAATNKVRCAPSLKGTMYSAFAGKVVNLPKDGPSPKALEHHFAEFSRQIEEA